LLKFKLTRTATSVEYDKKQFEYYTDNLDVGNYTIEVRKVKNPRSLAQNRYYYGCVVKTLSDKFKIDIDTMHETLKYLFLRHDEYQEAIGIAIVSIKSTTDLTTSEFEVFLERVRRWAMEEHNLEIPLPNATEYYY
jgi:hypothetical protein